MAPPAPLASQDLTDAALELLPVTCCLTFLLVNRIMMIWIDSAPPGPNHPRTASGQKAAFQLEQYPNVAAMRWRGWLGVLVLVWASLPSFNPDNPAMSPFR